MRDRNLGTIALAGLALWYVTRPTSPEGKVTILDVRRAPPTVKPVVSGLDET